MSRLYKVVATFTETYEEYIRADNIEELNDIIEEMDWNFAANPTEDASFEIDDVTIE